MGCRLITYAENKVEKCRIHIFIGKRRRRGPRARARRRVKRGSRRARGRARRRKRRSVSRVIHLVGQLRVRSRMGRSTITICGLVTGTRKGTRNRHVSRVRFRRIKAVSTITSIITIYCLLGRLRISRVLTSPIHIKCNRIGYMRKFLPIPTPTATCLVGRVPVCTKGLRKRFYAPAKTTLLGRFIGGCRRVPILRVRRVNCNFKGERCRELGYIHTVLKRAQSGIRRRVLRLYYGLSSVASRRVKCTARLLVGRNTLSICASSVRVGGGQPKVLLAYVYETRRGRCFLRLVFGRASALKIERCFYEECKLGQGVSRIRARCKAIRIGETSKCKTIGRGLRCSSISGVTRRRD